MGSGKVALVNIPVHRGILVIRISKIQVLSGPKCTDLAPIAHTVEETQGCIAERDSWRDSPVALTQRFSHVRLEVMTNKRKIRRNFQAHL